MGMLIILSRHDNSNVIFLIFILENITSDSILMDRNGHMAAFGEDLHEISRDTQGKKKSCQPCSNSGV